MTISLPPELNKMIDAKVASGAYPSANEVVREALVLMNELDEKRSGLLADLNEELLYRLGSLDRGEYSDAAALRAHMQELSRKKRLEAA